MAKAKVRAKQPTATNAWAAPQAKRLACPAAFRQPATHRMEQRGNALVTWATPIVGFETTCAGTWTDSCPEENVLARCRLSAGTDYESVTFWYPNAVNMAYPDAAAYESYCVIIGGTVE